MSKGNGLTGALRETKHIPFSADEKLNFLRELLLHLTANVRLALTTFLHKPKIRKAISVFLFGIKYIMAI